MKVMSFNIRMANPKDGEHYWEHRKESVAAIIRAERPDVLGTQEGTAETLGWLDQHIGPYRRFGVARDGRGEGECSAVYVHEDAGEVVDYGDFWLSDTPHVPGSRSFGNRQNRMATWVRLRAKGTDREWTFCNVHTDHAHAGSREQSARLLWKTLQGLSPEGPAVLMGDLNTVPASLPIQFLTGHAAIQGETGALKDSLLVAEEAENAALGTFHNFEGVEGAAGRIDYILVSQDVRVKRAAVVIDSPTRRVVSDHFPVTAEIE